MLDHDAINVGHDMTTVSATLAIRLAEGLVIAFPSLLDDDDSSAPAKKTKRGSKRRTDEGPSVGGCIQSDATALAVVAMRASSDLESENMRLKSAIAELRERVKGFTRRSFGVARKKKMHRRAVA